MWTEEYEEDLQKLKTYLSSAPLLSKPIDGEILYVYLVVSEHALSAVLVWEEEGKQSPIYYVSKALLDSETRYSHMEKLALAIITAAQTLRPYFQSHPISVQTSFPLKNILNKPELSRRLMKWAIELSEHHIDY